MRIEAGDAFTRAATRYADRVAVKDTLGQERTYRQLRERANRLGSALRQSGIAVGDRVGVLSHNRLEVLEAWLGLERFNIVRVVLHSHFGMQTHQRTLNDVGARALLFHEAFTDALGAVRHELRGVELFVCVGEQCPPWAEPYDALLARGSTADPCLEAEENDPCFLQLTTGTTGTPKPWIHTHRSWRAVVENNIEHLDHFGRGSVSVGEDDVNLHFHALQWATGFQTLMPYLLKGALTVIADDQVFDPETLADQILGYGATGTLIPAPMLDPLLDVLERRGTTATTLRRMVIFFATPDLLERATRVLGDCWCHGYGSTEQGAPVTRLVWDEAADTPDALSSVGRRASSFTEVRIVDESGEPVPPGAVGEIVVRTPMAAAGYWGLPERTSAAFFPGGWFRAGDVGRMDETGLVHYLDRSKDRIVTAQGTVYPHIVEARLLGHPLVANCGVTGLPNGPDGQAVVAAVLLKDGDHDLDAVRAQLGALAAAGPEHERPREILFVDTLPTVLGGAKVQREVLANQLAGQAADLAR